MFSWLCLCMLGCNTPPNAIRILSSIPNPGNEQTHFSGPTAQIIEEDYGATMANITTVRLIDQHDRPFGAGEGRVFSYYRGRPKIKVAWKDSHHLAIECLDCINGTTTLKESKHNEIEILYAQ